MQFGITSMWGNNKLYVYSLCCAKRVVSVCALCFLFLNRLLSDVSLSLIMHQKCRSFLPTKCACKVVALKKTALVECASHWQVEPLPKRVKLDCHNGKEHNGGPSQVDAERIKTFTAVTHLSPFLALHRVHCTVLLHAKKKRCKGGNLQENKQLTLLCGNISLSLAEISRGKYSINLKDFKHTGKLKRNWRTTVWIYLFFFVTVAVIGN